MTQGSQFRSLHEDTGERDGYSAWSASRHTHEEEVEHFVGKSTLTERCPEHRILMHLACDEYACLASYHDWWIDHTGMWHDRATDPPGGRVDITRAATSSPAA